MNSFQASAIPGNVVELLQALVRIPSVNPDGDPGVAHPGELACAEYLAAFLRHAGARVELQPVLPDRPNVVGFFPSDRPGKKRIVFAPHTDTVSVVGMTIDPFAAEERDGKIWGRGASDTKGPMAAMLWALWELRDQIPSLGYEIVFAGLMGEEAGQHGAKAFVEAYPADFALVGEPTELGIVHTHKGSSWLTLTTRGVAVHASTPERGENAIYKMMSVIGHLNETVIPRWQGLVDPVLGSPTISVGLIRGGSKTNIVPDFCEAQLDCRTIPAQGHEPAGEPLLAELRTICPDLEARHLASMPLWTDPAHPLIAALECAGGRREGAPWFCDAAVFAAAGIPAVATGPGAIAQAHTKDEWIDVEALRGGVEFYKRFLLQLA
jgi:acetylornithine deacetylase/succinyl-diaminopimelate desuccinylase-like protein